MSKFYYRTLFVSVILCLIVPCYGLLKLYSKTEITDTDPVRYNFVSVDGPIQPIPTIGHINSDWVLLGKALFHSPLLSGDNTVACASCHMVDFGGDDGFPVSTGIGNQQGTRNSPTVLNSVFNFKQFWDGRAKNLTEQAVGPIHNPIEMNSNWPQVINKLSNDDYFSEQFEKLTGTQANAETIVEALVIYQSSLITPNSPIDQFLTGKTTALSKQQQYGYKLFKEIGCSTCHQGINIGGNIFQRMGKLQQENTSLSDDLGRYGLTNDPSDRHVFKVPTLRNIALTAPYFHNGSVNTLTEAVTIMARLQLGKDLSPDETDALVALLHSFTGELQTGNTK